MIASLPLVIGRSYRSLGRDQQGQILSNIVGQSPEAIRSDFPTLSLEQVYGAITFYLGHKDHVDNEIAAHGCVEDAFSEVQTAPPDLKRK